MGEFHIRSTFGCSTCYYDH